MFEKLMQDFVKWFDPKVEKYRSRAPERPVKAPQSLDELVKLIQRTPKTVFSTKDRARLAALMEFEHRTVQDLMTPKSQMVLVHAEDVLGPLKLDELYKSGLTDFPVLDGEGKIIGVLHTDSLNALAVKTTDSAREHLDTNIYYLHATDSLAVAVRQILLQNSLYFLVLDRDEALVGAFSLRMVLEYLGVG